MTIPTQHRKNIRTMHAKGWTLGDIASMTGLTRKQVRTIIAEQEHEKSPEYRNEPDLMKGAREMLKAGFDRRVVAGVFGEENLP